jgi:protocatechuate 3,4-dioxygenase beta subunit
MVGLLQNRKMMIMKKIQFILIALLLITACADSNSQQQQTKDKTVGGRCEGCEAIHESTVPFDQLSYIDTLPDFKDAGEKIEVSGIVYRKDGKTPAKDVVIYVYHTDQAGIYPMKGDEKGWAKRHGFIRGWMRTNEKGAYKFYTLRPASYPNSTNPQHIHVTVKEPGFTEYWIDDYHFNDDPLITTDIRRSEGKRCGSGLLSLQKQNGLLAAKRDIILGLNIPGYD